MKIIIEQQQLHVEQIDVIANSSCSNIQIGDNDQVVLNSVIESPPDGIQIGPFRPTSKRSLRSARNLLQLPEPSIRKGIVHHEP